MLSILIFFVLGAALGAIGLLLLAYWEQPRPNKSHFVHWHRRH
jgi:hypothetical protein